MGTFSTLWDNYPLQSREDLFNALGGGWPALITDHAYDNTCTIRFSVALNKSGLPVPTDLAAKDGGLRDGAGHPIAIRVATAEEIVTRQFGASFWGMSHQPGAPLDLSTVPPRNGILIYRVKGGDASGHVDLWNGHGCRNDCHSQYALACFGIALWTLS